MTVKHWGGEAGIAWFSVHITCSDAWDTMISYTALISTPGMTCGKVLANPVPNGIKKKVSPQVEVIIVDNKRWNKITENQIKLVDVAKEWMHGCVMKNVQKIKIKLENNWIDLIRSIYAPYTDIPNHNQGPLLLLPVPMPQIGAFCEILCNCTLPKGFPLLWRGYNLICNKV